MPSLLFEHPLNERIRNYLKLEHLFQQLDNSSNYDIKTTYASFFSTLFSIIDTLERNDIRGDLIKELEKLEQNLVIWSQAPNVDNSRLEDNLKQTIALLCELKKTQQLWMQYKEDKFLTSLKQRFAMQGGTCAFDVPQLHFWLNQDPEQIQNELAEWMTMFNSISTSLFLILRFIRLRSDFEPIDTDSGFYQGNGESLSLLRIKTPEDAHYYPTVSGNKFRYSIRFVIPCVETGRRYLKQPITFELAKC